MLLSKGAVLETRDSDGRTALLIAAFSESRCRLDAMGRPKVRKPRAAQRLLASLLRFALQFKRSVLVGRHPGEPVARERRRRSNGAKGGQ